MVNTTFWLEYHLWGLDPLGYHIVKVMLHWLNAVVLWMVLARLSVPGAWLVAAVFALHPVHVESVAWITERKNVLPGFFYLAAPLMPFLLLGFALGLTTVWVEKNIVGARGEQWTSLSFLDRFLVAGRALWFYAGKLVWPSRLTFNYPRWHIDAGVAWQYLFPFSAATAVAALWYFRKRIGKAPLVAVLFFIGTLVPALGFFDVYPMRYSFVADHFQYLASLGLITLFVAIIWKLWERYLPGLPRYAAGVVLVVLLGTLVWKQGYIYKDLETLWRDTLAKNPSSWMAYNNLGMELGIQSRFDEALPAFYTALRLKPDNFKAHHNLGKTLSQMGRLDETVSHFNESLRMRPKFVSAHMGLGLALAGQNRFHEAGEHFSRVLELQPGSAPAHLNWGLALYRQGRLSEAISHYSEALKIKADFAEAHNAMGVALASQEKYLEALDHFNAALRLDPDSEDTRANHEFLLQLMREKGMTPKKDFTP